MCSGSGSDLSRLAPVDGESLLRRRDPLHTSVQRLGCGVWRVQYGVWSVVCVRGALSMHERRVGRPSAHQKLAFSVSR